MSPPEINILVIGETGSGKSALCFGLSGDHRYHSSNQPVGVTTQWQAYDRLKNGVLLFDMVGCGEDSHGKLSPQDCWINLKNLIQTAKHLNLIILVSGPRHTKSTRDNLNFIKALELNIPILHVHQRTSFEWPAKPCNCILNDGNQLSVKNIGGLRSSEHETWECRDGVSVHLNSHHKLEGTTMVGTNIYGSDMEWQNLSDQGIAREKKEREELMASILKFSESAQQIDPIVGLKGILFLANLIYFCVTKKMLYWTSPARAFYLLMISHGFSAKEAEEKANKFEAENQGVNSVRKAWQTFGGMQHRPENKK